MITQDQLKELLHYYPDTGIFTWKVDRSTARIGNVAGYINNEGYRMIGILGFHILAHRLAFLYMEGYLPEGRVDHKNRIRHDNRWENLREASPQCNIRNSKLSKNNKSGVVGVYWAPRYQKWEAGITVNRKNLYLGRYKEFSDAVRARWDAEVKYEFPNCNTSSTAFLFLQNN